jgi:hypothetical protein
MSGNMNKHRVQLQYTKKEVRALLDTAYRHHVDRGGCYVTQSAAIHICSQDDAPAHQRDTTAPLGTLYFDWTTLRLTDIDCEAPFALADALIELGKLETLAFGKKMYGQ